MGLFTRDFFEYIPGDIASGLKLKIAENGEAVTPELIEALTSEERIAVVLAVELLVIEAQVKYRRMVVRAIIVIAVLAAVVILQLAVGEGLPKSFYEFLMMTFA